MRSVNDDAFWPDAPVQRDGPASGEPDELPSEAVDQATTVPVRSPAPRDAIWKSVIGATGGYGCERETFYREVVRNERGYRLSFGMPEPVIFGVAVDRAHGYLMGRRIADGPADTSLLGIDLSDEGEGMPLVESVLYDLAADAVRAGVATARGRATDHPWEPEEWKLLTDRLGLAVEKLLGLWPNRVKERKARGSDEITYVPEPEPEGTPAGPPIGWLDPAPGELVQPQRKIHAPGVVGGRGITGQPDYVVVRDRVIVGWCDVKALGKSGSYPAKWLGGEAVAYAYLTTVENGGIVPEWQAYLEYRRDTKPYWALIKAPVEPSAIPLANAYFRRWERALDGGDPDSLSFNPKNCAKCQYREAMPRYSHPGCPIGAPAMAIAPAPEDDEV